MYIYGIIFGKEYIHAFANHSIRACTNVHDISYKSIANMRIKTRMHVQTSSRCTLGTIGCAAYGQTHPYKTNEANGVIEFESAGTMSRLSSIYV